MSLDVVGSIVNVLREVDARPIRAAAETPFVLAFLSRDLPLAQHFVDLLYHGLREHDIPAARVCGAFPLGAPSQPGRMNIAVIVTREDVDTTIEQTLARELDLAGARVLVCLIADPQTPPSMRHVWLPASLITLNSPIDDAQTARQLTQGILGLKAVDELALARHLPAFRERVSRNLIDDTALANAVYSFGSGIVEINPIADVPMNVADMMVLTKNQALMGYKIALAMGLAAEFRQIMPQLATVVGSGFLLRQAARASAGHWGAAIVMVSSFVGRRALPMFSSYCASKFALEALSESLRVELYDDRISVSVINPGVTRTEFGAAAKGARPTYFIGTRNGMSAAAVAQVLLKAVRRPRRNRYLTAAGKAGIVAQHFVPGLVDRVLVLSTRRARQAGRGGAGAAQP